MKASSPGAMVLIPAEIRDIPLFENFPQFIPRIYPRVLGKIKEKHMKASSRGAMVLIPVEVRDIPLFENEVTGFGIHSLYC